MYVYNSNLMLGVDVQFGFTRNTNRIDDDAADALLQFNFTITL